MSNAVWLIQYTLVEGASVPDFLLALEDVHREILSKQKGFISWKVLHDGDTWVDMVTWETAEDAKNAETAGATNPIAAKFYSYLAMETCNHQVFAVERSY